MKPVLEDLTVVIPTLGREILRESLASLVAGSAWPAEVVVVHQGTDPAVAGWVEMAGSRGLRVRYLPSAERGRALAVNRGIEAAVTALVCITDDDCLADSRWVEAMEARLHRHSGCIVTGRVEAGSDDVLVVVTSPTESIQRRPRLQFDGLSGGNMGMPVRLRERIGLLDEDPCLRTAEDGEFAYRALRAGIPIVFAPEVAVTHVGWRSAEQRDAQYLGYARSHGGFYGKYLRRGDWFIGLRAAVHHLRAAKRWLGGVWRGDADLAANGRAYTLGLLPGILAGWRSAGRSSEST
jgi:GT2 family glycosyltransferase